MEKFSRLSSSFLIALLGLGFSAPAAFSEDAVEVVQSVPIETTLLAPGMRQTREVWVEMISAAQKSIDLEQFYINNQAGQSLEPVMNALRAAAVRGVKVRLLVDSKFYKTYPNEPDSLAKLANVSVRQIDFSSYGGIQHAKYFVVDQSKSFVGSANFDWLALSHIHEVGLRVSDPQISAGLETVFEKDWKAGTSVAGQVLSTEPSNTPGFNLGNALSSLTGFQLVASPAAANPSGIADSLESITQLIGSAKASLKIQVYEYTTKVYHGSAHWTVLDTAIRQAIARGVHVQLLVDAVALKNGRADLQGLAHLANVEVRAVTVPQWSGGVISYARLVHSKYFVVDDSAGWVGTENWSDTYFTGSRNVGLIIHSTDTAVKLAQIFNQVWTSSYLSSP